MTAPLCAVSLVHVLGNRCCILHLLFSLLKTSQVPLCSLHWASSFDVSFKTVIEQSAYTKDLLRLSPDVPPGYKALILLNLLLVENSQILTKACNVHMVPATRTWLALQSRSLLGLSGHIVRAARMGTSLNLTCMLPRHIQLCSFLFLLRKQCIHYFLKGLSKLRWENGTAFRFMSKDVWSKVRFSRTWNVTLLLNKVQM